MQRSFIHAKIHMATVTEAELDYMGSITIDETLMEKVGILEGEKVLVAGKTGGHRLDTYVIKGERDSGTICMNGPAAHLIKKGEQIVIIAFALSEDTIPPKIALVDEKNRFVRFL